MDGPFRRSSQKSFPMKTFWCIYFVPFNSKLFDDLLYYWEHSWLIFWCKRMKWLPPLQASNKFINCLHNNYRFMRLSTTKLESENVTLILKINSEEELKFFEPVHHGAKLTKLIFNTQPCRKVLATCLLPKVFILGQ